MQELLISVPLSFSKGLFYHKIKLLPILSSLQLSFPGLSASQPVQQILHIFGKLCLCIDDLAADRMAENKPAGVECLPADQLRFFLSIQRISDNRMSQVLHMDPDLMSSSSLKPQCQEGESAVEPFQHSEVSDRWASAFHDSSPDRICFGPSQRGVDGSLIVFHDSMYNGIIILFDQIPSHHF